MDLYGFRRFIQLGFIWIYARDSSAVVNVNKLAAGVSSTSAWYMFYMSTFYMSTRLDKWRTLLFQ